MSGCSILTCLQGNEAVKRFFEQELQSGKLSHAYLLEGPSGSGRHTLVTAVISRLAADHPSGWKLEKGISPDFHRIAPLEGKRSVSIDQIRALKEDAGLLPSELDFKIFLLENADLMTVQAQNAALKILEEPPRGVYFFLLCENASQLLPTVRSRVPTVRMERFSPEKLREILFRDPAIASLARQDPARFDEVLRLSGGAVGRAKELLSGEKRSEKGNAGVREVLAALGEKDPAKLLPAIRKLGGGKKDRVLTDEALGELEKALRDLLLARAGAGDSEYLFFRSREDALSSPAAALPNGSLLLLLDRLRDARADLAQNANLALLRTALTPNLLLAAAGR